jgi:hypothetical protein
MRSRCSLLLKSLQQNVLRVCGKILSLVLVTVDGVRIGEWI